MERVLTFSSRHDVRAKYLWRTDSLFDSRMNFSTVDTSEPLKPAKHAKGIRARFHRSKGYHVARNLLEMPTAPVI